MEKKKQYRLTFTCWPMVSAHLAPNTTVIERDDKKETMGQLEGLLSMAADHEPRPCDKHVWDIKCEERIIEPTDWETVTLEQLQETT